MSSVLLDVRHEEHPDVDARTNRRRLAVLQATGLVGSEVEEAFDRLTRLAVRLVKVPAAFISLVDEERDFYKSACGFGEPLASARELRGETFCHYTIQGREPLVIPDTAAHPVYCHVPTVKSLGVAAYVGVPLVVAGEVVGAFCAIDMQPRAWTTEEVDVLVELAASAQREIELRGAMRQLELRTVAAEESNRTKTSFLAMMSHELRTPLNAIGGYSALLAEEVKGPMTEGQLDYVGRIQRSQRHLLGLINGILTYAQIDAGSVKYGAASVPVNEVLTIAVDLTMPQMRSRSISLRTQYPQTPLKAWGDEEKIQQIVLNLLSNAVKFTEPSGQVTLSASSGAQGRVEIRVSDTGCGIAATEAERIFLPFVQVGSDVTAKQGTGLGLAISREFAVGMGGDLLVDSTPGVGSTFTLVLPQADAR